MHDGILDDSDKVLDSRGLFKQFQCVHLLSVVATHVDVLDCYTLYHFLHNGHQRELIFLGETIIDRVDALVDFLKELFILLIHKDENVPHVLAHVVLVVLLRVRAVV